MMIGLDSQKNTFMMLPWVVLGLMLAVAFLVSVLYTAIMFLVNGEVLNGVLWLVFGPVAVGEYLTSVAFEIPSRIFNKILVTQKKNILKKAISSLFIIMDRGKIDRGNS